MANWNKLTVRQFSAIKTLLKGGATQAEAAEYMHVSPNTAFWVNKAETYEEYLNMQAERVLGKKKQVAAIKAKETKENQPEATETALKQPGGTLSAGYQINRIVELLKAQNETLTILSNKVAFIVDELTK